MSTKLDENVNSEHVPTFDEVVSHVKESIVHHQGASYEPKAHEVFKEMGRTVKESQPAQVAFYSGAMAAYIGSCIYYVPTLYRQIGETGPLKEPTVKEPIYSILNIGMFGGFWTGAIIAAVQLGYGLSHYPKSYIALLSITNAASGVYELSRRKLIKEHNESLEGRLENQCLPTIRDHDDTPLKIGTLSNSSQV
jgi:hypothetical protein